MIQIMSFPFGELILFGKDCYKNLDTKTSKFCLTKIKLFRLILGPIAQLVELPAHNRTVRGSTPLGPTMI